MTTNLDRIRAQADIVLTMTPEQAQESIGNLGGRVAAGKLRYLGYYTYTRSETGERVFIERA